MAKKVGKVPPKYEREDVKEEDRNGSREHEHRTLLTLQHWQMGGRRETERLVTCVCGKKALLWLTCISQEGDEDVVEDPYYPESIGNNEADHIGV